ncbi:MAG: exodeoxyribonuclease VII small subunit [Blastocatellia bacterium]|nr:exodeoxyribonuclease VII small subunit [Blastocatellia bacterium]
MAKSKEKEQGFEESLTSLERIVAQLESGELPLERALELFEDGVGLARRCQAQLEDAERKVEVLLRERGELKTVPFQPNGEAPAAKEPPRSAPDELEKADSDFDEAIPF